jgi:hypothetical protein
MTFVVFSTVSGLICLLLAEMGAARFHGFPSLPKPLQLVLFVSGFTSLVLMVNALSKGSVPSSFDWNITFISGAFALIVMMGVGFKMVLDSFD